MHTLYVALSGSHAYGFPSATSDLDIRKIHVAPIGTLFEEMGSNASPTKGVFGTVESSYHTGLTVVDEVSYEVGRFVHLLKGGNAGMYEIAMSPIVLYQHEWAETLRRAARESTCQRHVKHHLGLAHSEWAGSLVPHYDENARLQGYNAYTIKKLLYAFRSLLAAVAVIESDAYTVDIQSLMENAATCSPSLDVRSVVGELIAMRRVRKEKSMISLEEADAYGITDAYKQLAENVETFFSEKGNWLPEHVSPSVTRDLTHILREIRVDAAKEEFSLT